MTLQQLPEEIEKYIIKTYFHYSDIYYLSPVCKKWRDINNYITELKVFFKKTFECCLTYPTDCMIRNIYYLELVDGFKYRRNWTQYDILNYKQYSKPDRSREDLAWDAERKTDQLKHLHYNSGHFNELDMVKKCQTIGSMIQLTYAPDGLEFTSRSRDILKQLKKIVQGLRNKYLKDDKNKGFKIRLHKRKNYIRNAFTLIIWK